RTFPDSHICLTLVGDKLVMTGQAKDVAEATQILRVVVSNAPKTSSEATQVPVGPINLTATSSEIGLTGTTTQSVQRSIEDYRLAGAASVINLLRIPGEQQVMLKVTVAEMNRAAARSIGVNFSISNSQGVTVFANTTGNIVGGGTPGGGIGSGTGSGVS